MSNRIVFENVNKVYGNNSVLENLSFTIEKNEFFVLFGPSGVGKSTLLKLICGLEYVSSGSIYIDDEDVTVKPASKRGIRMAFENYTLYPHLSVYDNLSGVLKNNHVPKQEIDRKVHETTKMLGIEQFLKRLPKQLSGGQKQRVSLGRALVMEAPTYLLDEPLAHLDAKLRNELRTEFQSLKSTLGDATVVYVTHDYSEAMALGDRVCVLYDKHIAQLDTPEEIYIHPANLAVAKMFGQPEINVLELKLDSAGERLVSEYFSTGKLSEKLKYQLSGYDKETVFFACRPRNWNYSFEKPEETGYCEAETVGAEIRNFRGIIICKLPDGKYISILTENYISVKAGQKIYIKPDLDKSYLFDAETEENMERKGNAGCHQ